MIFRKVTLLSAVPTIFSGPRLGLVYALLGVIGGEMIAAQHGLGQYLSDLAGTFPTNGVFAVLLLLGLIGSRSGGTSTGNTRSRSDVVRGGQGHGYDPCHSLCRWSAYGTIADGMGATGRDEKVVVTEAVNRLVDEFRVRCLWFLRPEYYPATLEERLRVLLYIERHGDRDAFRRAATLKRRRSC